MILVRFKISDLQMQLRDINDLAKRFLDRGCESILDETANSLGYISLKDTEIKSWGVARDKPVRTIPSNGDYQRDGKGRFSLEGRLSFIWEVQRQRQRVHLTGLSSTEISFHRLDGTPDDCVFRWHADIKSSDGVGPHFHIQVHNPWGVDVPRFPSLMISPADCLDFMLGELFLDHWARHQADKDATKRFAPSQRERLRKVLEGMTVALSEGGRVSALNTLKVWTPRPDLLID